MANKKLKIIITVLLLIRPLFSLNTTDLCRNTLTCKGKLGFNCVTDLCTLNAETCDDYIKFIQVHLFHSSHILYNFLKNIKTCEIKSNMLTRNDYCLKNSNCFRKLSIWTSQGYITINKKQDCKCEGKHKYKCGNDYCAMDSQYCDLLQLRIKYQKKFNKKVVMHCSS